MEKDSRKPLHNRNIICNSFLRKDGLVDLEARFEDVKAHDWKDDKDTDFIHKGVAYHKMFLRMAIDNNFQIKECDAKIIDSPFSVCPLIEKSVKRMEGKFISRGYKKTVSELFNGTDSCTHLKEMLLVLAPVAYQTMAPLLFKNNALEAKKHLVNTCFAFDDKNEVIKKDYPDLYKG
jgi:hypothetical protein